MTARVFALTAIAAVFVLAAFQTSAAPDISFGDLLARWK